MFLALLILAQPVVVLPLGTGSIGANGTGSCPGTVVEDDCRMATIGDITIDLKTQLPPGASAGTVVLMHGGGSGGYMEQAGASAVTMVQDMSDVNNFIVIQAACGTPTGTTVAGCNVMAPGGAVGNKSASKRVATLLSLIDAHSTLHTPGTPMCMVTQSGGGTFAATAVVHYAAYQYLDYLITAGGPPFTREDWHCENRTRAEWNTILDTRQISGTGNGAVGLPELTDDAFGWNGRRGDCWMGSNRGSIPWRQDSIISQGADYSLHGSMKWSFLFGVNDVSTIVVPMARELADRIGAWNGNGTACSGGTNTACTETTVAGTSHTVMATSAGATAIINLLVTNCTVRP